MALSAIKVVMFIMTQFSYFNGIYGYFCEWFICNEAEQYCCGDNKCCDYFNYNTLYLWGGAILVGLLLVVTYYWMCSPVCKARTDNEKCPIIEQMANTTVSAFKVYFKRCD